MTFDEWWNDQTTRFLAAVFKDDALEIWEAATKSEREACAKVCEEAVTYPPGYNGQWEGYGPVTTTRDGKDCAAAIRERSND